jgi:DNA invertase Pin-like site-specific DNA recombinase
MRQRRSAVIKLIGYARVSNRQQSTDARQVEILAAGVLDTADLRHFTGIGDEAFAAFQDLITV